MESTRLAFSFHTHLSGFPICRQEKSPRNQIEDLLSNVLPGVKTCVWFVCLFVEFIYLCSCVCMCVHTHMHMHAHACMNAHIFHGRYVEVRGWLVLFHCVGPGMELRLSALAVSAQVPLPTSRLQNPVFTGAKAKDILSFKWKESRCKVCPVDCFKVSPTSSDPTVDAHRERTRQDQINSATRGERPAGTLQCHTCEPSGLESS